MADGVSDIDSAPRGEASADAAAHAAEDAARRAFLRMISHELRTPLNSVIGFSEIIARELHGPIGDVRYQNHAEVIRDSGLKLLKLVNQVMEIARLDARAADLDTQPDAVGPVVQAAMRALAADADAREVDLRLELDPATPLALLDARALETVLQNLLRNAVTYAPAGSEVLVLVRPVGAAAEIKVRDRGPGVEKAQLHRLLNPFVQGENPLVRRTEGAGLGLAIARLLCREMGGSLALASEPGRGFVARVRLRAAPTTPDEG
jgi:signal transduction histidine kinase